LFFIKQKTKKNAKKVEKIQYKKCKLKNIIFITSSSVFPFGRYIVTSLHRYKFSRFSSQYKMSYTRNSNKGKGKYSGSTATTPFCKVCYDAKLPAEKYTSHFVKDQPGPNGRVVCPTLLAQKCLICGAPGHTSSYCPDNSSVSSSTSTLQDSSRYKLADDEVRSYSSATRLPPIVYPRIVYASDIQKTKNSAAAFPSLPNLSSLRRFENDEPALRRDLPSEASPIHSPKKRAQVPYNKKSNPFGDLVTSHESDSDVESEDDAPVTRQEEQKKNPHPPSSSWASIAAGNKPTNKPTNNKSSESAQSKQSYHRARSCLSIVVPTAISAGPILPPISFKPKSVSSDQQVKKKFWGDTDSEDDEEFMKRGLN
jgi:hypothetical protein